MNSVIARAGNACTANESACSPNEIAVPSSFVQVGSSVEFDWTWEGAVAFKPRSIDGYEGLSDFALENTLHDDAIVWSGEILEVDEQNGCLFLSVDNPESIPTTGAFFVRPFEFLAVLDSVLQQKLSKT